MTQSETRSDPADRMLSTSVDDLKSTLGCTASNSSPTALLETCLKLFAKIDGNPRAGSKRKVIAAAARKAIKELEQNGGTDTAFSQADLAAAEEARNAFGGCA